MAPSYSQFLLAREAREAHDELKDAYLKWARAEMLLKTVEKEFGAAAKSDVRPSSELVKEVVQRRADARQLLSTFLVLQANCGSRVRRLIQEATQLEGER
ncbi:hypothetical protein WKW77_33895 [Variovorax ureilyticus]|uniref:Uncharacterized protein n=1 Tax=Variovorax ureilyticus TaxID=1836198 RepID=A0ABU8VQY4_9BURK